MERKGTGRTFSLAKALWLQKCLMLDEAWPKAQNIKLPALPGQLERDLRLS